MMIDGSKTVLYSLHKSCAQNIGRLKSILPTGEVGQFVAVERQDVGGILCSAIGSRSSNEPRTIGYLFTESKIPVLDPYAHTSQTYK